MQENVKEKANEKERELASTQGVGWRGRLHRALVEVTYGGVGLLLGQAEMLFGTYPLGLAALCASGSHILSVLIGLFLSVLIHGQAPIVYICAYAAAALVRFAASLILDHPDARMELPLRLRDRLKATEEDDACGSSAYDEAFEEDAQAPTRWTLFWQGVLNSARKDKLHAFREAFLDIFSESVCLRMATASVCAFIVALYRMIAGGFLYYDLFAAVFVVLVTPAAVMVYSVCMSDRIAHVGLRRVSQALLLFSVIRAANSLTVAGFALAAILAFFCTVYACNKEGAGIGVIAAVICGLAYHPLYIPAFLLAALTFLAFKRAQKEHTGIFFACLSALTWAMYAGGINALMTFLPACLIAGTLLTAAFRLSVELPEETRAMAGSADDRLRMESNRHRDSNERFRGISDAFSSLSEMFYNLSDRFRRPGTLDLRRICDSAFDQYCSDCPNKTVCWGLEYSSTLGTVNALISQLHTRGRVTNTQIPDALAHRCESVEDILTSINRECAKLTGELLKNNRTEIFAMDYESAASIINDALEEDDGEYRFDHELEEKLAEYLADAGVRAHSVTVYGNRRRRILVRGVDVEQATVTVETLRADLGEMCGLELGRPIFEVEGNVTTMTLQAKKKISVAGAQNNLSADGGVSGDSINLFSNKQDYFYALISDGMGAGKEAALTSSLCSVFLEKMLRAGNRAGTSLRMLNNMICSRGADSTRECSSTIDLIELDLMTAEASFIKSGAAPSFVIRGNIVHRLQAGTAPIGIIRALDMQVTPFALKPGDTVVMVSDGILPSDAEYDQLVRYLAGAGAYTPEEIVYHICRSAADRENHDDCSAVALRILEAE